MDYEKEIPFGAFDSELMHQEINIPEGFEATIEGNKIILKRAESEDEKIRKRLIDFFEDWRETRSHLWGINVNKILAWLEKQGECQVKESAIPQHENKTCKENNDSLTNKNERIKKDIIKMINNTCKGEWFIDSSKEECLSWLEKQGEQKPAAWSEEDDRIYYSILADIRIRQDGSTSTLEAYYNGKINWLKSLKERIGV